MAIVSGWVPPRFFSCSHTTLHMGGKQRPVLLKWSQWCSTACRYFGIKRLELLWNLCKGAMLRLLRLRHWDANEESSSYLHSIQDWWRQSSPDVRHWLHHSRADISSEDEAGGLLRKLVMRHYRSCEAQTVPHPNNGAAGHTLVHLDYVTYQKNIMTSPSLEKAKCHLLEDN